MCAIDNNKLIAEFMGYPSKSKDSIEATLTDNAYHWYLGWKKFYYISGDWHTEDYLLFHLDWNWLMSVVDRIESMSYVKGRRYYLSVDKSHVQIRIDRMNYQPYSKWGSSNDKLKATYKAVIEFINFYNRQQHEN